MSGNKAHLFFLFLTAHCCAVTISYAQLKSTPDSVSHPGGQEVHTIALLLPFEGNRVFIKDLTQGAYYFPDDAQLSVEYYQGALLALDSLKQSGFQAKLLVYDTGDSLHLDSILKSSEIAQAELIIGPLGSNDLIQVEKFSSEHQHYLLSPYSAMAICPRNDAHYLLANATMNLHCEKIYEHLEKYYQGQKVFLIHKTQDGDKDLANCFKTLLQAGNASNKNNLRFVELTDSTKNNIKHLPDSLSLMEKNVIVVASSDELFVKDVMKQLNGLPDGYELEVYGMPTWNKFKSISADQFEKANTYITSSFYIDKNDGITQHFKQQYNNKFGVNPTDHSAIGYNQLIYFGSLLKDNGISENSLMADTKAALPDNQFQFTPVPVSPADTSIWYYENKTVFLLKYDQGKLLRVNW